MTKYKIAIPAIAALICKLSSAQSSPIGNPSAAGQYSITGPDAQQNYTFGAKRSALPTGSTGFNYLYVVIQVPTAAPTINSAFHTGPCSFIISLRTNQIDFYSDTVGIHSLWPPHLWTTAQQRTSSQCSLGVETSIKITTAANGDVQAIIPITLMGSGFHIYMGSSYRTISNSDNSTIAGSGSGWIDMGAIGLGVSGTASGLCAASPQQLTQRTSTASAITFPSPAGLLNVPKSVPRFALSPTTPNYYCDPLYGYPILRISDDSMVAASVRTNDSAAFNEQVGFNSDGTKIQLGGRIISIDKTKFAVSAQEPLLMVPTLDGINPLPDYGGSWSGVGVNPGYWHPRNPTQMFTYWESATHQYILSIDVTQKFHPFGSVFPAVMPAYVVADLTQLPVLTKSIPYYRAHPSFGRPALGNCYTSADLKTWACRIGFPGLDDRHPPTGTGCFVEGGNICQFPGYVVFRLNSTSRPNDPNGLPLTGTQLENFAITNWTEITHFMNGVDTADPSIYQTVTMGQGSVYLYNGYAGGYKVSLDPSGQFLFTGGLTRTGGFVVLNLNKTAVAADTSFFVLNNMADHGAIAPGKLYFESPNSIKVWDMLSSALVYGDGSASVNPGTDLIPDVAGGVLSSYLGLDGSGSNIIQYVGPPWAGSPQVYQNEIRTVNTSTRNITRVAYMNAAPVPGCSGGIDLRQPMVSPNGDLIAFSTNFSDTAYACGGQNGLSYVMIVKLR